MIFNPNNLFYYMARTYVENKTDNNKVIFCNEGSSRSSKTWDEFHFLYWFCSELRDQTQKLQIYIARRTLKNCRELTYADFKECLIKMEVYDPENARSENSAPVYNLFGHTLNFIGLDNSSEARRNDIFIMAEAMEIEAEDLIKGWVARCELCIIADWNPKYTEHWIFKWEKRPNTFFTKTTYRNNKHLKQSVVAGIEEASPWMIEDLHLPEAKRRPHETNIANGTANKWWFLVYGMGERASREGLCYPNVTWIDAMPTADRYFYGLDFGFHVDPTAFVRIAVLGNDLFMELLVYKPMPTVLLLNDLLTSLNITGQDVIIADSADGSNARTYTDGYVKDLRSYGFQVIKAKKRPGYKADAIYNANKYNIHFVRNSDLQNEQQNYSYQVINGIATNQPDDGNDHALDAMIYALQAVRAPMRVV